jgi:lactoylglutathione lyase
MEFYRARCELFVTDLDRTERFYESVLGLIPTRHPGGYVALRGGGVEIGLGSVGNLRIGHHFRHANFVEPRGLGVEIVLEVDDVDACYLKAQRAIALTPGALERIKDQEWGLRDFRIVDPDGYYLRVTNRRTVP